MLHVAYIYIGAGASTFARINVHTFKLFNPFICLSHMWTF